MKYLSKCCNVEVEVEPEEELKAPEGKTFYFQCPKCCSSCDVEVIK